MHRLKVVGRDNNAVVVKDESGQQYWLTVNHGEFKIDGSNSTMPIAFIDRPETRGRFLVNAIPNTMSGWPDHSVGMTWETAVVTHLNRILEAGEIGYNGELSDLVKFPPTAEPTPD